MIHLPGKHLINAYNDYWTNRMIIQRLHNYYVMVARHLTLNFLSNSTSSFIDVLRRWTAGQSTNVFWMTCIWITAECTRWPSSSSDTSSSATFSLPSSSWTSATVRKLSRSVDSLVGYCELGVSRNESVTLIS